MTTPTKAAVLYPYFLSCRRQIGTSQGQGQSLEEQMVKKLQADSLSPHYFYAITLQDVDNPGQHADWLAELDRCTLKQFPPARVWKWAAQQVENRTEHYLSLPATGWHVYLQGGPRRDSQVEGTPLHLYANATGDELVGLLRGLYAYQNKLRKQARRLVAQCWAYHWQQQRVQAEAAQAAQQAAMPALSCLHIPAGEYDRRADAAEELAVAKARQYGHPAERYGREILWHPAFAADYVASVSRAPLHEVARQQAQLADCNQGRPLDRYDYAYLADLLREALAAEPAKLAALRLGRALEWVEQAGTGRPLPAAPAVETDGQSSQLALAA